MAYIQYAVYYGNTLLYRGNANGSFNITYNGKTWATVNSATSKTMSCAGKMAKTNIVVGAKTLACGGKMMKNNITIRSTTSTGSNYQTLTSSGSFTIPYGVNAVTVFCVGGGGGGGAGVGGTANSHGGNSGAGSGGGGGGYTAKQTIGSASSPVGGKSLTANIGSGGSGCNVVYRNMSSTSTDHYACRGSFATRGGTTTATLNGVTVTAAGGYPGASCMTMTGGYHVMSGSVTLSPSWGGSESAGIHKGGDGGSGGGGAGVLGYNDNDRYTSNKSGNGGTNGGAGQTTATGRNGGSGQGTSTIFNGVTYSGGGGGGAGYNEAVSSSGNGHDEYFYRGEGGVSGGGPGGGAQYVSPGPTRANSNGVAGTAGTGGGGGGGANGYNTSDTRPGGNGGSGAVIVTW